MWAGGQTTITFVFLSVWKKHVIFVFLTLSDNQTKAITVGGLGLCVNILQPFKLEWDVFLCATKCHLITPHALSFATVADL